MELPAAAWVPCEFQLANWIPQEPAAGLPVEYASIDIPATTCGLQAYEQPESSGVLLQQQQQLVEYYNYYSDAAASRHNANSTTGEKAAVDSDATSVVKQVVGEFKEYMGKMEKRMHRYPACLRSVDKAYTLPRIVAIGPYHNPGHHGPDHLKPAETMKHAAACYCIMQSGCLLEDLFGAVVSIEDNVASLYDKDVMEGIDPEDFRHMMFFDACFLVQFMLMRTLLRRSDRDDIDNSRLLDFLSPNRIDIFRDVMLLKNQIPWIVVETIMRSMRMPSTIVENFVRAYRHCMLPDDDYRDERPKQKPFKWDDSYKPLHLLDLLRYYIVGRNDNEREYKPKSMPKNIPASVSVVRLTEIGITLTANKTTDLIDMSLNEGLLAELSLPPLSLDRERASYLVNMAAFELCTVKSFSRAKAHQSAFCSYLMLLAMLVSREEDVHELRVRGLLVGGGGLTNKEALNFFKTFQGMRVGRFYYYVMDQIDSYRENKRMQTKCCSFFHRNWTTICTFASVFGSVVAIIVTIVLSFNK